MSINRMVSNIASEHGLLDVANTLRRGEPGSH